MTADELARVTAERDAAVAALARVEALADEWRTTASALDDDANGWVHAVLDDLRDALAGPESDAGAEVAPGATGDVTGAQDAACGCYACIGNLPAGEGPSWLTLGMTRMIVCDLCGNKRCPHGTDHRNDCTKSNDVGQPGSRYEGAWTHE